MWKDYLDKGFYAGVSWRLFSKTTQNDTKEVFGQKNEPIQTFLLTGDGYSKSY